MRSYISREEALSAKPDVKATKIVGEWIRFSTSNQKEKDIEYRILNEPDLICIAYVCKFSRLSEEFIERMIVLTSGLICNENIEEYDDVKELCDAKYRGDYDLTKTINKYTWDSRKQTFEYKVCECSARDVNDKIDWLYIAQYQKLSDEFIRKYINVLPKQVLLANQNMSMTLRAELVKQQSEDDDSDDIEEISREEVMEQMIKSLNSDDNDNKPKSKGAKTKSKSRKAKTKE